MALAGSVERLLSLTTNFVVSRFRGPRRPEIEALEGSMELRLTVTTNFVVNRFIGSGRPLYSWQRKRFIRV